MRESSRISGKFVRISRRKSDALLAILMFVMGVIYIILLVPIFWPGTEILGVINHHFANGFLSYFEMVWQPICAFFYFIAFAKIMWPEKIFAKKEVRIFAILPLFASFIEALVLNIYQLIVTHISRNFVDGIFTTNAHYPVFLAAIYIVTPPFVIVFLSHYFAKNKTEKRLNFREKSGKNKDVK